MKIANIDRESFWRTWGISMKFLEKMCLIKISKVTKKNRVLSSVYKIHFWKNPQGGPAFLGLRRTELFQIKHYLLMESFKRYI